MSVNSQTDRAATHDLYYPVLYVIAHLLIHLLIHRIQDDARDQPQNEKLIFLLTSFGTLLKTCPLEDEFCGNELNWCMGFF